MNTSDLTPTQRKILELLADGMPHTRREIHSLLSDELGDLSNIQPHISHLRKALRPDGHAIVCEIVSRRICYRWVRLLAPDGA